MKHALAVFAILLSACASAHPGCMTADRPVECVNASRNAPRLTKVEVGMTKDQVRSIMEHDPERREAESSTEVWYYMSDYNASLMTAITFTNGRVASLRSVPWRAE